MERLRREAEEVRAAAAAAAAAASPAALAAAEAEVARLDAALASAMARRDAAADAAASRQAAAAAAAATRAAEDPWQRAAEGAVSLAALLRFTESLPQGPSGRTTKSVVDDVITPATSAARCRLIDLPGGPIGPADVWRRDSPGGARPLWFVSHAFGNPFRLLADTLRAHFRGEDPSGVYVWLVRRHLIEGPIVRDP